MKFLTLESGQLGALLDDTVVDLTQAATELDLQPVPATLQQIIGWSDEQVSALWALAQVAVDQRIASRPFGAVVPLAPIPRPARNIFCLGKNYLEHAREVADRMAVQEEKVPSHPIIFTKATTAVIASGEPIPSYPDLTQKLDYEAELALIIGREGRDIAPEDAMSYVFGYTAFNDVSARDLQKNHVQWFRAKSLDGFAPMGPVVVHRMAMPPVEEIEITCRVNGELRQQATLAQLIFDLPTIISTLSQGMTLLPGDIIATGTPGGVGMGFRPGKYLKAGDEVVISVTGVGELVNPVGS